MTKEMNETHILIVDDEQYSRSLLKRILHDLGYANIAMANDGGEALKVLLSASTPIDCVLTDINMSPVNGLELLKLIRIGCRTIKRDTPVIFFSGLVDMELVPPAIQLDVNGFLAKPVAKNSLDDAIKHALSIKLTTQTPRVYQRVRIPTSTDLEAISVNLGLGPALPKLASSPSTLDNEHHKPDLSTNLDGMQEVVLSQSYTGHFLAKDIVSQNDVILLTAGVRLTERTIRRILDLQKIDSSMGDTVFVNQ